MALVTILTPTYNRADYLPKLYASLQNQTLDDWDWLVVDDGSTDGTEALVRKWCASDGNHVRYIHKANGGKHTALNVGIALVTARYTFLVDSDDCLLPEAVATVAMYDRKYTPLREEKKLCGFSFLRVNEAGEVNAGEFPVDNALGNYAANRVNVGDEGDKAEVFYTDVLKRYPFPEFAGERFLPEDAVWMKMSEDYNMIFANRKVYVCDYLEGGLTKSGRSMKIHSPLGMMYRSAVYLKNPQLNNFRVRCKMIVLYQIYEQFAKEKGKFHKPSEGKVTGTLEMPEIWRGVLWAILTPVSVVTFQRWSRKYR